MAQPKFELPQYNDNSFFRNLDQQETEIVDDPHFDDDLIAQNQRIQESFDLEATR